MGQQTLIGWQAKDASRQCEWSISQFYQSLKNFENDDEHENEKNQLTTAEIQQKARP